MEALSMGVPDLFEVQAVVKALLAQGGAVSPLASLHHHHHHYHHHHHNSPPPPSHHHHHHQQQQQQQQPHQLHPQPHQPHTQQHQHAPSEGAAAAPAATPTVTPPISPTTMPAGTAAASASRAAPHSPPRPLVTPSCSRLRHFSLRGHTYVSDACLAAIAAAMPGLESLALDLSPLALDSAWNPFASSAFLLEGGPYGWAVCPCMCAYDRVCLGARKHVFPCCTVLLESGSCRCTVYTCVRVGVQGRTGVLFARMRVCASVGVFCTHACLRVCWFFLHACVSSRLLVPFARLRACASVGAFWLCEGVVECRCAWVFGWAWLFVFVRADMCARQQVCSSRASACAHQID